MKIIIKNITANNIQIQDLFNISILANSTMTLVDDYPNDFISFSLVQSSDILKSFVISGQLVVNDGINDLSISDGLYHLLGVTKHELLKISPTPTGKYIQFTFNDSNRYYKKISDSNVYSSVCRFIFEGSNIWGTLLNCKSIASLDDNGTGYFQLFDVTNNKIICQSLGFTNQNDSIIDYGVISNVPLTESIFELRAKSNNTTILISNFMMVFQ